jgi:hypothetical protein
MANLGRKRLPRLMTLGADFDKSGLSVKPDPRYDLVCDYLKASPSYESVMRKMAKQKSPYPLPKDYKVVAQVVKDFGLIYKMREADWWDKVGKRLYGISAPLPNVKVLDTLDNSNQSVIASWNGIDSVVAELPLNLTLAQAMKQLRKQLVDFNFSAALPKQAAPKYQLSNSKLRIDTLQNGLTALRMYKRGFPLWKIGNDLRLIPAQSFIEKDAEKIGIDLLVSAFEIIDIIYNHLRSFDHIKNGKL